MSKSNFVDLSIDDDDDDDDDDDETAVSNSGSPELISRQFWKAGNYKVAQRQGHEAGNNSKTFLLLIIILCVEYFKFDLLDKYDNIRLSRHWCITVMVNIHPIC